MTRTGAERQADFRRKRNYEQTVAAEASALSAARAAELEQALRDVIELTGDKKGEAAVAIRARCEAALN